MGSTGVGVNWTWGLSDKGTGGADEDGRAALGKVIVVVIEVEPGGLKVTVVAVGVLVKVVLVPGVEPIVVVVLTPIGGVVVMEPVVVMPSVGVGGPGAAAAPVVAWACALAGASRPSANAKLATTPRTSSIVLSLGSRV